MTCYVALLRAVNVGGTGKLPMAELKRLAEACDFARVRTYIASGNLLLDSASDEAEVKATLEAALQAYAGKPVGVAVRTAAELAQVLTANPWPEAPANRSVVIFLDSAPPADALDTARGRTRERLALGRREIYVWYVDGQADAKLIIPAAGTGTARNLNTIAKLVEIAG